MDDFAYDNNLHLDLQPPAVDPAAEVASTFSWPAAQRELANPRMLLLKLQTVVHIVFEYGIEPPALLQELESIAERGIFRPDKIESVSMACAHLCQWVLDVIEIARRHSLAHDDDDDDEEEEEEEEEEDGKEKEEKEQGGEQRRSEQEQEQDIKGGGAACSRAALEEVMTDGALYTLVDRNQLERNQTRVSGPSASTSSTRAWRTGRPPWPRGARPRARSSW